MRTILTVLLVGLLIAAMAFFAVVGVRQRYRRRILARKAHETGMRFSADDPFELPRRYGHFVLISCGHSASSSNVTYGHIEGWPFRAFDFRCEIGHGPRRESKNYCACILQTEHDMPNLFMWHENDKEFPPLEVHLCRQRLDGWLFSGSEEFAGKLAEVLRQSPVEINVQACGNVILLAVAVGRDKDYVKCLDAVWQAAVQIKGQLTA